MTTRFEAVGVVVDTLARTGATFISSLGTKRVSETNVLRRPQFAPLPEHWRSLRTICRAGEALGTLDDPVAVDQLMLGVTRMLVDLGDDLSRKLNLRHDHLLGALLQARAAPMPTGGELERMVGIGRISCSFFGACSQAAQEASAGNGAPSAEHIGLLLSAMTSTRQLAGAKSRRAWRFFVIEIEDRLGLAKGVAGDQVTFVDEILADLQRLLALSGDLPASNPMTDMNLPAMV